VEDIQNMNTSKIITPIFLALSLIGAIMLVVSTMPIEKTVTHVNLKYENVDDARKMQQLCLSRQFVVKITTIEEGWHIICTKTTKSGQK
jgi:hypothetical protein